MARGGPPRDALPAFDKSENSAFLRFLKPQILAAGIPFLEETEKSALRQPMLHPKNFVYFDKKWSPGGAGRRCKIPREFVGPYNNRSNTDKNVCYKEF